MIAAHQFGRWSENERNQRRIALRRLFREVAKRVHPDLASDETDRSRRERLMAEANQAFEHKDAYRLAKTLEEYEARQEAAPGTVVAAELAPAVRKITLKMRLQLTFVERYDNDQMRSHRSLLAGHLLARAPRDQIQEEVLNFFEEMHLFLHESYLDEELLWSTFGFSAVRWWAASEDYVAGERNSRNDHTLFSGFQDLAVRFFNRDALASFQEPTPAGLKWFLEEERKLGPASDAAFRAWNPISEQRENERVSYQREGP